MNSDFAQKILQDAAARLNDMGNGDEFSLAQQDAIINAIVSAMNKKIRSAESSSGVVFKIDGNEVRVGQDMRVEATLPDGSTLIVTLTHEGIIMDFWPEGATEPGATSSITYDEQAVEMTG